MFVGMYKFACTYACGDHRSTSDVFLSFSFFFFPRQGFSVLPWLSWNSLCRPGWPRTQKSMCLCLPSAGIKGVVAHAFNPSTREAEADGFLSSRPAWSTEWVPGQPGLHRETLSRKTKKKKKKNQNWKPTRRWDGIFMTWGRVKSSYIWHKTENKNKSQKQVDLIKS